MLIRSASSGSIGSSASTSSRTSGFGKALRRINSLSSLGSVGSPLSRSSFGSPLSRSGLPQRAQANRAEDVAGEESGEWKYLVIDSNGIRAREDASYCRETKRADSHRRYKEGDIVTVDRRRTAGWTKWLRLDNGGGWLFDVSPKDKKVRLVEVEVTLRTGVYECGHERVPVLQKPFLNLALKPTYVSREAVHMDETIIVMEKVRPINSRGSFLRLADGRGWVFDSVDGFQVFDKNKEWENPNSDQNVSTFLGAAEDFPCLNAEDHHSQAGDGIEAFRADETSTSATRSDFLSHVASDDPLPGVGHGLGRPEAGTWEYMVVDRSGISLRSSPTYDQLQKISSRIEEGAIVTVVERIPADGITFLRLAQPEGWCFDRQPGGAAKNRVRMVEVSVERGDWFYSIVAERGVGLRSRCSFSSSAKAGTGPLKGALVEISQRLRFGESTFLRLKDGSGWIFDVKKNLQVAHGPVDMEALPAYTVGTVLTSPSLGGGWFDKSTSTAGVYLRSSPTGEKWAATKSFLPINSKVNASLSCEAEGVRWLFVAKGGSGMEMEGWVLAETISLQSSLDGLRAGLENLRPSQQNGCAAQALWSPQSASLRGAASPIVEQHRPAGPA